MRIRRRCRALAALVAIASSACAQPVSVRLLQGSTHGFLLLKSESGKVLATGDEISTVQGNLVHTRVRFQFLDGSVDDETTVFSQGKVFRLIRDHHVQRGPSFPKPLDLAIDVPAGEAYWREEKNGKSELKKKHLDMPADMANGMMSVLLANYPRKASEMDVSYVVAEPNPAVVTLSIRPEGEENFELGGEARRANRYLLHVELHGLKGVIAPLLGKAPADDHAWVLADEVPTFLRLTAALYDQGPVWLVELASPTWSAGSK